MEKWIEEIERAAKAADEMGGVYVARSDDPVVVFPTVACPANVLRLIEELRVRDRALELASTTDTDSVAAKDYMDTARDEREKERTL